MKDLISLLGSDDTKEKCGLIVKGKILELTNIHEKPETGFRMDPQQLVEHVGEATATWHTHPKSTPVLSEEDYAGFTQWPELVHHIVGVRNGNVEVETYQVKNKLVVKR